MICYLRLFKVYQFKQNNKQNNSKNQYMYGQCDDFFGCELLSMNCREDEIGDLQKDDLNLYKSQNPTGVDQENSYLDSIKTLSIKKVLPKFQISFQKDFMKEHINVFAGVYSNYREFFGKCQKQNQYQNSQDHNTFHQDQQTPSVSFLLNNYDHSLTLLQKNQFLKDLIHQDRLLQFLTLVTKNSSPQDSLRLILVGRKVWMKYTTHQKNSFSISEIIKLTDKICQEEVFAYSKGLFLSQGQQNKLTAKEIEQFIMKFSVTILLVINEYFENPYFGDNQSDRRFKRISEFSFFSESSDEDGESFCNGPTKKRKLSF